MARKSKRRQTSRATKHGAGSSNRDKAIASLMSLLAEHRSSRSACRRSLPTQSCRSPTCAPNSPRRWRSSPPTSRRSTAPVLAGIDADMAEESPRERLFDVLMRRLEILEPHKEAVRSLMRSASCNPGLALALNGLAVRSQQWMLTAADIGASGPKGMLRAQGLALLFANVLRTWVNDDDDGHAKTLAALDRELARGQRFAGMLDELCKLPERACAMTQRSRRGSGRRGRERAAA